MVSIGLGVAVGGKVVRVGVLGIVDFRVGVHAIVGDVVLV